MDGLYIFCFYHLNSLILNLIPPQRREETKIRLTIIRADIKKRNIVIGKKPIFKRLQLIPTISNRPHRITTRKLSCYEILSAIAWEY